MIVLSKTSSKYLKFYASSIVYYVFSFVVSVNFGQESYSMEENGNTETKSPQQMYDYVKKVLIEYKECKKSTLLPFIKNLNGDFSKGDSERIFEIAFNQLRNLTDCYDKVHFSCVYPKIWSKGLEYIRYDQQASGKATSGSINPKIIICSAFEDTIWESAVLKHMLETPKYFEIEEIESNPLKDYSSREAKVEYFKSMFEYIFELCRFESRLMQELDVKYSLVMNIKNNSKIPETSPCVSYEKKVTGEFMKICQLEMRILNFARSSDSIKMKLFSVFQENKEEFFEHINIRDMLNFLDKETYVKSLRIIKNTTRKLEMLNFNGFKKNQSGVSSKISIHPLSNKSNVVLDKLRKKLESKNKNGKKTSINISLEEIEKAKQEAEKAAQELLEQVSLEEKGKSKKKKQNKKKAKKKKEANQPITFAQNSVQKIKATPQKSSDEIELRYHNGKVISAGTPPVLTSSLSSGRKSPNPVHPKVVQASMVQPVSKTKNPTSPKVHPPVNPAKAMPKEHSQITPPIAIQTSPSTKKDIPTKPQPMDSRKIGGEQRLPLSSSSNFSNNTSSQTLSPIKILKKEERDEPLVQNLGKVPDFVLQNQDSVKNEEAMPFVQEQPQNSPSEQKEKRSKKLWNGVSHVFAKKKSQEKAKEQKEENSHPVLSPVAQNSVVIGPAISSLKPIYVPVPVPVAPQLQTGGHSWRPYTTTTFSDKDIKFVAQTNGTSSGSIHVIHRDADMVEKVNNGLRKKIFGLKSMIKIYLGQECLTSSLLQNQVRNGYGLVPVIHHGGEAGAQEQRLLMEDIGKMEALLKENGYEEGPEGQWQKK